MKTDQGMTIIRIEQQALVQLRATLEWARETGRVPWRLTVAMDGADFKFKVDEQSWGPPLSGGKLVTS